MRFSDILEGKNITIINNIDDNCTISFDQESLNIIIRNLIHNAIKFSYPGSNIYVSSVHQNVKKIIIRDHGVGMPDEVLDNWTKDHFFQSNKGTFGEQGSGLGLALCRTVAQMNDCHLYFKKGEDKGTVAILEWKG